MPTEREIILAWLRSGEGIGGDDYVCSGPRERPMAWQAPLKQPCAHVREKYAVRSPNRSTGISVSTRTAHASEITAVSTLPKRALGALSCVGAVSATIRTGRQDPRAQFTGAHKAMRFAGPSILLVVPLLLAGIAWVSSAEREFLADLVLPNGKTAAETISPYMERLIQEGYTAPLALPEHKP